MVYTSLPSYYARSYMHCFVLAGRVQGNNVCLVAMPHACYIAGYIYVGNSNISQ